MEQQRATHEEDVTVFAETNFRNHRRRFGIKEDDRLRHMYIIGKTGMGKSTTLENMIIDDIRSGKGVCVVDPHGDLVEKVIDYIPSNRVNDVVYFNPYDFDFPIAFNVLEAKNPQQRYLIASGLIGVFKKIWIDSWGPRLEYLLRNTILALLENPGTTMLGITRMFVDKDFRSKVIDNVQDPIIKAFWVDEFTAYSNQFRTEALSPIQNKVGQFLSSSIMRNILGQTKSTIDLRDIMDNKKILLLNLSKGRIGEDNSSLLGAMMITKIQLAAMSRVEIPEKDRVNFYLYVDEFQNFATESFEAILSEARKYHLNLIIAHQYIEQLEENVQAAVFGNVGTIMCFRVGAEDAEFLEKEFEPTFMMNDLVNLTKFQVYLKLMIDGVSSEPFSAAGLPPFPDEAKENTKEKIIRLTRERYGRPRQVIEEKIMRWSNIGRQDSRAPGGVERRSDVRKPRSDNERGMPDRGGPTGSPSAPQRPRPMGNDRKRIDGAPQQPPQSISMKDALTRQPTTFRGKGRPSRDRRRPDQRDQKRPQNRPQQDNVMKPGEVFKPRQGQT